MIFPPVAQQLERNARTRPDSPAYLDRARTLTWREADERARAMALRLRELGAGRGTRVAILLANTVESAVMLHAVVPVRGGSYAVAGGLCHKDRGLITTPLCMAGSLNLAFLPYLYSGASCALTDETKGEPAVGLIETLGVTTLFAVPLVSRRIAEAATSERLASLRFILSSGAELPSELLHDLVGLGIDVHEAAGTSESAGGIYITQTQRALRRRSVGVAMPGCSVEIRAPSTGERLPDGVSGEMVIAGPIVGRGYLRAGGGIEPFPAGGTRSGDLGHRDEDGFFFVTGRLKDTIVTGGQNVHPVDVEEVLRSMPGIRDVVVLGCPDPQWGEVVSALVIPADAALTPDGVIGLARSRLAPYQVPKQVALVDAFPYTSMGKLDRKRLTSGCAGLPWHAPGDGRSPAGSGESAPDVAKVRTAVMPEGARPSGSAYAGQVVVITGAGRGLGREHALAFAALGARVVVNDYSVTPSGEVDTAGQPAAEVVEEICAAGGEAVADGNSVATAEGAEGIFRTAMEAFGRVDVLVNNAGFLRDRSFGKMTDDEWSSVLAVHLHLHGGYRVTRACWTELQRTAGAVLFTTSHAGLLGQFGQANYAAAKSGLVGLALTLAHEGRRHGVRVNTVAPIATTRLSSLANERLREAVAGFDPRYVAALATFICAGDATGGVFMAGHGAYSRFLLMETEPLRFDHVPTMAELGAAWSALDGSGHSCGR